MADLQSIQLRLGLAALALGRSVREGVPRVIDAVVNPKFVQAKLDGVERFGQWLAVATLPVVVVISFAVMTVINQLMGQVMGDWDVNDQTPILGWLVTFLTLGMFVLFAYGWFQYVRTAGFGFLSWRDE